MQSLSLWACPIHFMLNIHFKVRLDMYPLTANVCHAANFNFTKEGSRNQRQFNSSRNQLIGEDQNLTQTFRCSKCLSEYGDYRTFIREKFKNMSVKQRKDAIYELAKLSKLSTFNSPWIIITSTTSSDTSHNSLKVW